MKLSEKYDEFAGKTFVFKRLKLIFFSDLFLWRAVFIFDRVVQQKIDICIHICIYLL